MYVEICRRYREIFTVLLLAGCAGLEDVRRPAPSSFALAPVVGPLGTGGASDVPERERCQGTLEDVAVQGLTVPQGEECRLEGIRVRGEIQVLAGAVLVARGVWVGGRIVADHAREIRILDNTLVNEGMVVRKGAIVLVEASTVSGVLRVEGAGTRFMVLGSRVDGDLHVRDTEGTFFLDTRVAGDAMLEDNRGPIWLEGNEFRGNLLVVGNVGGVDLRSNRLFRRLDCRRNDPGLRGMQNTVRGRESRCTLIPARASQEGVLGSIGGGGHAVFP